MTKRRAVLIALFVLCAAAARAHEVPDRVRIAVFVKPSGNELQLLVRMPANALIDFLLPTLDVGNWVDLAHAGDMAQQGAQVWIADMLLLSENGVALPRPDVVAYRLSRVNDPSFATFDDALSRVRGAPLPVETLALQEQLTVDALLTTPIASAASHFSFTPKFSRLGVVVDTTVTFVAPDGATRTFAFQGDPVAFPLQPTRNEGLARFSAAAWDHFLGEEDYWLLALCFALWLTSMGGLTSGTVALSASQLVTVTTMYALGLVSPTLRAVVGVVIAALVVYVGIEAIVASARQRLTLAIVSGVVVGAACWFAVRPDLQYAGAHAVSATLAFALSFALIQAVVLVGLAAAVFVARRLTQVPRAVVVIPAAIAIHLAWRQLLDRADGLALVSIYSPTGDPALLLILGGATIAALGSTAMVLLRRDQRQRRA